MEVKKQKKPRSDLHLERFKEGLLVWYKITYEELIKNYTYCGGDGGNYEHSEHYNYWVMLFGYDGWPCKEQECVCGVRIVENCFVMDETRTNFIHMGNCCIKKFMPKNKSGRTCEICKEPHRNIKYNLCNDCKTTNKKCETCKEYFEFDDKKHEYCDECYEKNKKREREERKRKYEMKQREIEENYKKNMNAKKGLMNANQTATKIKQIKQCSECNQNYETYDTLEEQCLCTNCKQTKQAQINEENRRIKEENIKKNQRVGLMCYCELRTTLREVKKDGPNKGKLFYCCSKSYNNDDKCDYFMWKDESDRRINKNIQINFEEQKEEQIEENNESNEMICYCNLPAIQLIVKKYGPNNGRKFYKCSKYNDDKCKYFKWEDEI